MKVVLERAAKGRIILRAFKEVAEILPNGNETLRYVIRETGKVPHEAAVTKPHFENLQGAEIIPQKLCMLRPWIRRIWPWKVEFWGIAKGEIHFALQPLSMDAEHSEVLMHFKRYSGMGYGEIIVPDSSESRDISVYEECRPQIERFLELFGGSVTKVILDACIVK